MNIQRTPQVSLDRLDDLSVFLRWSAAWVIPIVTALPEKQRFDTLSDVAESVGYGDSDSALSAVCFESLLSTTAETMLLRSLQKGKKVLKKVLKMFLKSSLKKI